MNKRHKPKPTLSKKALLQAKTFFFLLNTFKHKQTVKDSKTAHCRLVILKSKRLVQLINKLKHMENVQRQRQKNSCELLKEQTRKCEPHSPAQRRPLQFSCHQMFPTVLRSSSFDLSWSRVHLLCVVCSQVLGQHTLPQAISLSHGSLPQPQRPVL